MGSTARQSPDDWALVGERPGKLRSFRPGAEEGTAISALLDRAVETDALEGVLAAVRDGLSGLGEEAAHELLATSAGAQVDRQVSWRIAADTAGKPPGPGEPAPGPSPPQVSGAGPLGWPPRVGGPLGGLYEAPGRGPPRRTPTPLPLAAGR